MYMRFGIQCTIILRLPSGGSTMEQPLKWLVCKLFTGLDQTCGSGKTYG